MYVRLSSAERNKVDWLTRLQYKGSAAARNSGNRIPYYVAVQLDSFV
jgi:hypothetical protein